MLGIDLRSSRELRASFLAMRNAAPEIGKQLRAGIKTIALPEWQAALRNSAASPAQSTVLVGTAKVKVSNQNIRLSAGDSAKRLSGGARVRDLAHAAEFGADRDKRKTYQAHRKGRSFTVHNRHTTRQLRLPRRRGYVVYPAGAQIIPRIASLAVQTVVRTLLDAIDGKG